jgi:ATP-dependent Lon protease
MAWSRPPITGDSPTPAAHLLQRRQLPGDGSYEIKGRKFPFYVREFIPLQYTRLNLSDFIEKRPLFTDDEWLDLLIQSVGFNPLRFDRCIKMLMLLRLLPFVEANYNLIELGQRKTGK